MKANSVTLKNLKKQVIALQRKERASAKKLRNALAKARKMGKAFQRKLELKSKEVKTKVAAREAAVYHKLANSIKKKAKNVRVKKTKKSPLVKAKIGKRPPKRKKRRNKL